MWFFWQQVRNLSGVFWWFEYQKIERKHSTRHLTNPNISMDNRLGGSNGRASDSSSEGCVFKSRPGHMWFFWQQVRNLSGVFWWFEYQKIERKHSTRHLTNPNIMICRGTVDRASTLYSEGWVFEPRLGYRGVLSSNMLTHTNTRLRTYFLQNSMLFSMRARMSSRNVVNALKFQV